MSPSSYRGDTRGEALDEARHTTPDPLRLVVARAAALLLFAAMLSGVSILFAPYPAVAMSAHRSGAIEAAVMLGLAGIWPLLDASPRARRWLAWGTVIGMWGNWAGVQWSAFTGAHRMIVVTGDDYGAEHVATWMDVVMIVLLLTSVVTFATSLIAFWALRRPAHTPAVSTRR